MLRSRLPEIVVELDLLVQEGIEHGAGTVARRAQERVPVKTGQLRDAIHVEPGMNSAYVIAGNNNVWYGHLVEHGTTHTSPRPFLVPALEESRDEVTKDIKDRLRAL